MSTLRCKMCGGDLIFEPGSTVCECEFCGGKQTLPTVDNEKKVNLYNRANRLRMASEFDKAAGIYEQIIAEFPEEAEAYFCLCLCNYGIEYVDDPATSEKIPTCHRASFDKMRKDENYELALENAEMSARLVYEDQAKEIDRIMGDILSVSRNEPPYDIFICYKETDNSGARTPDSVLAQDIYDALTAKGYRVFFSRITLEDKLGTQYEPYIFAALNTAKIMLAVGTDYEYFNAVWVKNEWSRFLKLMAKDRTKVLIPCYKDMDPYDMPDEFKDLQAQDCGKLGFLQDLVRGIDKLFGKDRESNVGNFSPKSGGGATVDSLLKRVFLFLEDGKWQEANEYCEKVLDIDPECAQAYLGKLMAELHVKKREQLADRAEPFDNNDNYSKVIRFGDKKMEAEMRGYIAHIKERNEQNRLEGIYRDACKTLDTATKESDCYSAAKLFDSIQKYKDSKALAKKCREQAEVCLKQKEEAQKHEAERINQTVEAIRVAVEKKIGEESCALLENELAEVQLKISKSTALSAELDEKESKLGTVEAEKKTIVDEIKNLSSRRNSLGIFAGKEKKEINRKIEELTDRTKELEEQSQEVKEFIRRYTSRASLEAEINTNQEQIEVLNKQIIEEKKKIPASGLSFEQAKKALEDPKVETRFREQYKKLYIRTLMIGDSMTFGTYPQNEDGEDKTPISWKILAKKDDKILVISKYGLDCQQYNTSYINVTWETCTLRTWLNNTFINDAFSAKEQALIATATVTADKNPNYSTSAGNDTQDQIFLLSITEVEKYFTSDNDRMCVPTAYAIAQGADPDSDDSADGAATCWWWLRSPGLSSDLAAGVLIGGSVDYIGDGVDYGYDCVRPALWINLGS